MKNLLIKLIDDYPTIRFEAGQQFSWSPQDRRIIYKRAVPEQKIGAWSLLHEVGHATLDHSSYSSDFELLQLEVAAWQEAEQLAAGYGYSIDAEHIQDCLDTYRDWLHRRSSCPVCGNKSIQDNLRLYVCFNCHTKWQVTASKFCRPYRKLATNNQASEISLDKLPANIGFH